MEAERSSMIRLWAEQDILAVVQELRFSTMGDQVRILASVSGADEDLHVVGVDLAGDPFI